MQELGKAYNSVDVSTVAREVINNITVLATMVYCLPNKLDLVCIYELKTCVLQYVNINDIVYVVINLLLLCSVLLSFNKGKLPELSIIICIHLDSALALTSSP